MRPVAELKPLRPHRLHRGRRTIPPPRPKPRQQLFSDGGRAWINGAEVGGTDPRYAHLNRSYD
jgi:hypothetical protein